MTCDLFSAPIIAPDEVLSQGDTIRANFSGHAHDKNCCGPLVVLIINSLDVFGQAPGRWITNKFAPLP